MASVPAEAARGHGDAGRGMRKTKRTASTKSIRRKRQAGNDGADVCQADSHTGEPPVAKKIRTQSQFTELRLSIKNASSVAALIQHNLSTKLRTPRWVNSFFQAMSNCPEDLFATLCREYKREVCLMLERMLELYTNSGGAHMQMKMLPAAHEFIIRCEQNGVRKNEWSTDILEKDGATEGDQTNVTVDGKAPSSQSAVDAVTPKAVPLLVLSPRDLIKKIAAIDPRGRLERLIEMSTTVLDLHKCANRLLKKSETAGAESEKSLDYATMCQLIGKLASKARRVCEVVLRDKGLSSDALEVPKNCSSEDIETLDAVLESLLIITRHTIARRSPANPKQPVARLGHLVRWCSSHGFIMEGKTQKYQEALQSLDEQASLDLRTLEGQLEAVLILKGLPPGDERAAQKELEKLWNDSLGRYDPCSVDVLSSIAVVAGADGMSEDFRSLVAKRLMRTHKQLESECQDGTARLPRRALNFVLAQQSREKQKIVKRMLAEEGHVTERES
ncbi:hypothetical protein ERJ75_001352100 [Trypanosoma vivax]|uniref:Uncharacterized protein n=1 Tax=Trypanosoma vivax (strain Y486) TaxID=1055687 RepID=G0UCY3_TRYVY|nr:hypothetical protein TRVL_07093 [Trypanosoma vivax]KAH8608093.1 hypothetical protein ERJ75_001352100 [Trypanosoma vivax]CCC53693.1 conserved hypothetical protein [Trypanosoma vivax Y486]